VQTVCRCVALLLPAWHLKLCVTSRAAESDLAPNWFSRQWLTVSDPFAVCQVVVEVVERCHQVVVDAQPPLAPCCTADGIPCCVWSGHWHLLEWRRVACSAGQALPLAPCGARVSQVLDVDQPAGLHPLYNPKKPGEVGSCMRVTGLSATLFLHCQSSRL